MSTEPETGAQDQTDGQPEGQAEGPPAPLLRVVKGDPTPEELAALVAVVSAVAAGSGGPAAPRPRSEWAAPGHRLRGSHRHGRGAWRAAGLPH